jgi:hypothetical protein
MKVRFPSRSEFLEALRLGIKEQRPRLDLGHLIEIHLDPGGYKGRWFVIVREEEEEEFEVVGSMRDPTRFPQRIKVAALALLQEGAYGRFDIMHDRESGIVSIKRDG